MYTLLWSRKRANSTDINSSKKMVELEGIGSYRYDVKDDGKGRSKMANYGNNLMRNSSMEQTQVYKRQEKEFNIINFHPKEHKPALKQFPKLSLEHRLIENRNRQPAWSLAFLSPELSSTNHQYHDTDVQGLYYYDGVLPGCTSSR